MMNIKDILKPVSREQLKILSRQDLIELLLGEQDIRKQSETFVRQLEEEKYLIGEKYVRIKNRVFLPSSEKGPKGNKKGKEGKGKLDNKKKPQDRTRLPSDRYPDAHIHEQDIELIPLPSCTCCGEQMSDSGMTDSSETLSVIPKQFVIKRQIYHKYCCRSCHGSVQTAPTLPRIKPGSSYDDEFMIDVAMSKYCDLIPIERYCAIASRLGFVGLPPHSLIELTHYLADFLRPVYALIKLEILAATVLYADETTHRMLEGDEKSHWYLWGFSCDKAAYFEYHDTRSGSVASTILLLAICKFLVSDVYSGYNKGRLEANKEREQKGLDPIENAFCNAHARRKFRELDGDLGTYFVEKYAEIYRNEAEIKDKSAEERLYERQKIIPVFEEMKQQAIQLLEQVSTQSSAAKAANYFIKNFVGLTRFLHDAQVPIDNNHQERLLRNAVIGRKTWYGTHSKRGAETAAILLSIVESCKLNKLNPRTYLQQLIKDMHQGKKPHTPRQAAIDAAALSPLT